MWCPGVNAASLLPRNRGAIRVPNESDVDVSMRPHEAVWRIRATQEAKIMPPCEQMHVDDSSGQQRSHERLLQRLEDLTVAAPSHAEEEISPSTPEVLLEIILRSVSTRSETLRADPRPVVLAGLRLVYHWSLPWAALWLLAALCSPGLPTSWQKGLLAALAVVLWELYHSWQIERGIRGVSKVKSGFYYAPTSRNRVLAQACPSLQPGYYEARQTPWLWNGDFTTFFPFIAMRASRIPYIRKWVQMEDGEKVATDWAFPQDGFDPSKPVLLVLHGLNGGSDEVYILDILPRLLEKGWSCVVMINRGLMKTPIKKNIFNGARMTDVHAVVRLLQRTVGELGAPICATGFSMGAVILANYCGQYGDPERRREGDYVPPFAFEAAICHSGLVDAVKNSSFKYGRQLWQPFLSYQLKETFMGRFHEQLRAKGILPDAVCGGDVVSITDFDRETICKFYDYQDTDAYYADMSLAYYGRMKTLSKPLLMLHACDDPIIDCDSYESAVEAVNGGQDNLFLAITKTGGHVGWPLGWWPVKRTWEHMANVTEEFVEASLRK